MTVITASASLSSITASAQFKQQTVSAGGDTTPPTFSVAPASSNVQDTSFDITATLNEWGTVYSLVQAQAAAAPSVVTIKSTGESAIATGSSVTISHTGLTASTAYTAYVVAADDDDNTQAAATDVDVTTASGYDSDSLAWFAQGSFTTAQKDAYDTFVLNLKTGVTHSSDLWTNAVGIFLFMGESAANNAINGRTPANSGTFYNTPTHASTGVTFNGSTQYFDTGINANTSLSLNDVAFSVYQTTDVDELGIHGCRDATNFFHLIPHTSSTFNARLFQSSVTNLAQTSSGGNGLFTGVRRGASEAELYQNGSSLGTETDASSGKPNYNVFIGARNNVGSAEFFVGNTVRVAYLSTGLTDNQVVDLNAAVSQLFTDLGI